MLWEVSEGLIRDVLGFFLFGCAGEEDVGGVKNIGSFGGLL